MNDQNWIIELERQRDENLEILRRVRLDLQAARSRAAATGCYADPRWYYQAEKDLRTRGDRDQRLTRQIAELRRQLHPERRWETKFVDHARRLLTPATFEKIEAAVRDELAEEPELREPETA
jgi:hypothetical protein